MDVGSRDRGGQVAGTAETTANSRLASFLLARIAEDEVRAVNGPEAAQAEARARRRLVETHRHHDHHDHDDHHDGTCGDPCYTLCILAQRYPNHPDLPTEAMT
ncbi:hypothetical protein [Kribbella shirazensis]|uniref:Uncharacterized protein n=1 Tax=Kribbella shirazensis TaxID=1105143 RepID=A0A7X5VJF0_9ACTN|nr:hypothetical protein [Kribbella shirazensis]NIK61492.1 hypothetical protein [Kribbella shirazensis]